MHYLWYKLLSTNHTLESWFTNLEQTPLNHCQKLPAPYKGLLNNNNKKTNKQQTLRVHQPIGTTTRDL